MLRAQPEEIVFLDFVRALVQRACVDVHILRILLYSILQLQVMMLLGECDSHGQKLVPLKDHYRVGRRLLLLEPRHW